MHQSGETEPQQEACRADGQSDRSEMGHRFLHLLRLADEVGKQYLLHEASYSEVSGRHRSLAPTPEIVVAGPSEALTQNK